LNAAWILLALLQAGAPEGPAPQLPIKGADLQLLGDVRRIGGRVVELRGEAFERPPLALRVPDDIRRVAAEIRATNVLTRDRLEARGRAWADLGLGGIGTPASLLRTMATDLEGIGFDPEGNRLLVAPDRLDVSDFAPETSEQQEVSDLLQMTGVRIDEPVVAHMLMHVRQRERSTHDALEATTDRLLASMAWAEGEANLVAIQYLFAGMNLAEMVVEHDLDPRSVLGGRLVPASLERASGVERRMLEFVYLEGFARAAERYRHGGWPAIDAAMARGRTTSALLHADAAEPQLFSPPEPPPGDGWLLADEDSLGEQGIVVLVSLGSGKDNLGLLAGDGWIGDRVYRWEAPGSDGITDWLTRWSNPQAAQDFAYGFGRALAARFPEGRLSSPAVGLQMMESGGRVYRMERAGDAVRVRVAPAPAS
jgi:hypothetical protein